MAIVAVITLKLEAQVSLSSGAAQEFNYTASPALAEVTISVTSLGDIANGYVIKLNVPIGWNCSFKGSATVTLSGTASTKVDTTSYINSGKTLSIPVTTDFAAGDTLKISGLQLNSLRFVRPKDSKYSGAARLKLDYKGDGSTDVSDSYEITVSSDWSGGHFDGWDAASPSDKSNLKPPLNGTMLIFY